MAPSVVCSRQLLRPAPAAAPFTQRRPQPRRLLVTAQAAAGVVSGSAAAAACWSPGLALELVDFSTCLDAMHICMAGQLDMPAQLHVCSRAPPSFVQSEAQVRAEVTRRIKKLGRDGKPREAVAELASMAKLGVSPDTLAATALVDACARNGKMDMARRCGAGRRWVGQNGVGQKAPALVACLFRFQKTELQPGTLTYSSTAILKNAAPSVHLPHCSVFDELFGSLLAPDEVVFAVLLRGYGTASARPMWNEISSTLTEMEQKHGIAPSTGGLL